MECRIEIFLDGRWRKAAIFEPDAANLHRGIAGGCRLQYDIDYAFTCPGRKDAELIPGLTVGFELFRYAHWPTMSGDCPRP